MSCLPQVTELVSRETGFRFHTTGSRVVLGREVVAKILVAS